MRKIQLKDAKANLSAVVDQATRGKPSLITRHGKPVAEIVPSTPTVDRSKWIGSLKETKIIGDIISPANDEDEWEVLRD